MSYKTLDNQLSPELEELLKPVMKEVKYTDTVFNKTCGGEAMSEDVKPRIWKAISIEWRKDSLVRNVTTFKEECLSVIELEPTMRLMDELADALEFYSNKTKLDCGEMAFLKLEKYKKFKEALK